MSQHFLLSRTAKTLSLATVFCMSDADAEKTLRQVRWDETDGAAVCPKCGGLDAYEYRRETCALAFECRACKAHFSITSGTLFASHKLPLRMYLAAIANFCNQVKGKSMLAMSRDLGLSYKAAFVLCHKLREAMAAEMKGRMIGGEGVEASVDGAYFGGCAEAGDHHHISGPYLLRYAQEMAWREDSRRVANGEQVQRVAHLSLNAKPSVDFCGYWPRHKAA